MNKTTFVGIYKTRMCMKTPSYKPYIQNGKT